MTDDILERLRWEELDVRLSETFTPATAISRVDAFHGRHQIRRRLTSIVRQAGQHAIIYGERGVGKTSLANVMSPFMNRFVSQSLDKARVNCYRNTTYESIWDALLKQAGVAPKERFQEITPEYVIDTLLRAEGRHLIFIIDELDRIEDKSVSILLADTIKALSDFSMDATLILIGVADDVDDLIASHESIDRCLVQIHLPRMMPDELAMIVAEGMAAVDMDISTHAVMQIAAMSFGLPHYVHALGLAAGHAAIDRMSRSVDVCDIDAAVKSVISESQQTLLAKFDMATSSPRRQNNYFQALLACALAKTDDLGYFRPADARSAYSRIMGGAQNISVVTRYLNGLCGEKRGAALHRIGEPRKYKYRFADPLMQPYALMRGLERGIVGMDDVGA